MQVWSVFELCSILGMKYLYELCTGFLTHKSMAEDQQIETSYFNSHSFSAHVSETYFFEIHCLHKKINYANLESPTEGLTLNPPPELKLQ